MSVRRICVKASMVLALGASLALLAAACGGGAKSPAETPSPDVATFSLTSDAFAHEGSIPTRYTCDGDSVSPPLAWSGAPAETNAYALIMDDPDAPGGTFTHWLLYNVPPALADLPEGVAKEPVPEVAPQIGAPQGPNDAGGTGYTGPCPPSGAAHRYRFTLYALNETVDLQPGATKEDVLAAMEGHILAEAVLVGTYGR